MRNTKDWYSAEDLTLLLHDPDRMQRVRASFVLGSLGEEALPAVPVLIGMLQAGDIQDRKLAALTLGQIGPAASDAVPALLDTANHDCEEVAEMAVWALEEIDLADAEAA